MPQLAKGAKWAIGWVVVTDSGEVPIPPEAWLEYGFQAGGKAILIRGSSTSGGFSISTPGLVAALSGRLRAGDLPVLERGELTGRFSYSSVRETLAAPGDRLLSVRGSCLGLGFVAGGPIFQYALEHGDLLETYRGVG